MCVTTDGFGLVNGFIDCLQVVLQTTINLSIFTYLQFTVTHTSVLSLLLVQSPLSISLQRTLTQEL
jgi:hypothetical protein